jgi:hypothetical protein
MTLIGEGKFRLLVAAVLLGHGASVAGAEEDRKIELFDGQLVIQAAEAWERKQPATNIVEHEFRVPAAEGDEADGRLTVMAAGGSIDDNLDRWYGQFIQPDGGSTKELAKVKKLELAGETVHLVDMSGTFKDQKGPFAPAVERPKYRMLGAIVTLKNSRANYYVKFYGPQRTVAEQERAFTKMIEGLTRK